jgi:acetylornithine/succinyldiaminopimelate/putrescine aminotransferase
LEGLFLIISIVIILALFARSRHKAEQAQKNARADTDDHILEASMNLHGHSNITLITKDPQQYAKYFVPKSHKK